MDELKTPLEWANELGAKVIQPDGWFEEGRDFHDKVNRADFDRLLNKSTIDSSGYPSFSDEVTFVSPI